MIFKFALDPSCFESAHQKNLDDSVFEQHERFLEMWYRYGALVGDTNLHSFLDSQLRGMHQELRKRWQAAFKHDNRFRTLAVNQVSNKPLWEAEDGSDVQELSEQVQTVFVDQKKRNTFIRTWNKNSEICSFQSPSKSINHLDSQELDQIGITPMSQEKLWKKYFQPLAEISRNIVIVDRYAVNNLLETEESKKSRKMGGGMDFFLQKLSRLPKNHTVKIIAAALNLDGEDLNFKDRLKARLSDLEHQIKSNQLGSVRKLIISLLPNPVFRDEAHYRFIRFDKTCISTDKGVSVFDVNGVSYEVQRATLKRYIYPGNVCEQAEDELEGAEYLKNMRTFRKM